jgi:hypothetical protein
MKISEYVQATIDLMADTDWSRYTELQDASTGDIKAAAVALWNAAGEDKPEAPDADAMIRMLKNRYACFSDYSAMANGEDDTRRFMDRADEFNLTSGLMDRLNTEISHRLMDRYRDKKWHVVDLSRGLPDGPQLVYGVVESDEEGFYIFTNDSL